MTICQIKSLDAEASELHPLPIGYSRASCLLSVELAIIRTASNAPFPPKQAIELFITYHHSSDRRARLKTQLLSLPSPFSLSILLLPLTAFAAE